MSKSYRRPYGTWVCTRVSEHDTKTLCSRIWRRAQEQAVREALRDDAWDDFTLPARVEGKLGSEYDLRRDGHKRPMRRSREYFNQFAYNCKYVATDTEEEWRERQKHDDEYIAWASRK